MTIEAAVQYLTGKTEVKPPASAVVDALVAAEKQSRKQKNRYDYEALLGTWQLRLVSGTKAQRPGPGRYIPAWVNISITYGPQSKILTPLEPSLVSSSDQDQDINSLNNNHPNNSSSNDSRADDSDNCDNQKLVGAVANRVNIGAISLQLSGPTRYWPKTNSLGFDFVHLQLAISRWQLYHAPVRGGIEKAQTFADQSLKSQAFFTFFTVTQDYIAARGKGGGLALWTRIEES